MSNTWVILDCNDCAFHTGTKEQSDAEMHRLTHTVDGEPYENATKSWHGSGPFRQESRA